MNPNGVGVNLHCLACKLVFRVWFESVVKGRNRVAGELDTNDVWKCVKCGQDAVTIEDGASWWLMLSYYYALPVDVIKQIWSMWHYHEHGTFDKFIKQLLKEASEHA